MRLGHHFQGQKVEGQGHQAALLTAGLRHQAAAAVNVGRNVLTVGTYCYVAGPKITEKRYWQSRRRRFGGARHFGAHRERRGAGHIVAAPHSLLEMGIEPNLNSPGWVLAGLSKS